MELSNNKHWSNERHPCFTISKRLGAIASCTAPFLLLIAIFKQSLNDIGFAILAILMIPTFAVIGYGFCVFMRSMVLAFRIDNQPKNVFPSNWPFPFSLINRNHRLPNNPGMRKLGATFFLAYLNCFVILWNGFLLIFVIFGIVTMATR
jgi:hypothetical protein